MACRYCRTYYESESRPSGGIRFCLYARKMVEADDPSCDEFTITPNFWCRKNDHWMSFPMCSARQNSQTTLYPECTHCDQKQEILEMKRFAGLRRRNVGQIAETSSLILPEEVSAIPPRSKIILRREN
jgi:hypothetical protein